MKWKVLRHEFVDGIFTCRLGVKHHTVSSGIAVIIENDVGEIAFSGPCCAKNAKYVINPTEKVPNLTTNFIKICRNETKSSGGDKALSLANKEIVKNINCKLYLELLIVLIPLIGMDDDTDCENVNFIIGLIKKGYDRKEIIRNYGFLLLDIIDESNNTNYSLDYLNAIYTYIKKIDFLLNQDTCSNSDKDFLIGCKEYVMNHGCISEKQFALVQKKLEQYNSRIKYAPKF